MRIHSQEHIAFSKTRMQRNNTQIEKSLQKLGTGLKIAKGSDNASGLSISETMRAQIRGISRAQSNMQDGLSVLEASNEGLNNVNGLLQRARELAVANANGTLTDSDRDAGQKELDQILEAINDTSMKLEFNTKKILGDRAPIVLHVGANPGQSMQIDTIDVSTDKLGINGASLTSRTDAEQLITDIDKAISTISGHLTKVGSQMEAIEHHLTNAMVFEANLTKSLSLMADTDVAEEMMQFINLDIRQKGDHLLVSSVNKNLNDMLSLFSR
ncbi:flagellin [Sporosarcina sp. 179-K 3D1 HS]|uniref:flagellin n=1 Tax=Sporosarcina sp. 179-K 3D1 HS TaxID=3232169 RepID=UPI00399F9F7C